MPDREKDTAYIFSDAPADGDKPSAAIVADPLSKSAPARPVYPTASYKNKGASRPMPRQISPSQPMPPRTNPNPAPPPRPSAAGKDVLRYEFENSLLIRVESHPWPQKYNYYGRFCDDANRFFSVQGKPCPHEPYFSYIPQYAQLNHAQLAYYLWFRENARRGEFLEEIDLPYIFLYMYEIINLPDRIAPAEGARLLSELWLAYRRRKPELDRYLAEWMCDYCLVRQTPLPKSLYVIVPEILPRTSLKEFYIAESESGGVSARSLILSASDYSYRASKYYAANKDAYETHIPAAVTYAASVCGLAPDPAEMRRVRVERDAFCGSLCAQTVKRRLIVEYCSFARSYKLRAQITSAVKIAENCLRRALKVRSRLNVTDGEPALTAAIAAYFDENLPGERRRTAARTEDRAYEHLYDAPSTGIDYGEAHALETDSWATTEILTEEIADVPAAEEIPTPAVSEEAPTAEIPFADALSAVLAGESLTAWCKRQPNRTNPVEVAGKWNEYAADVLGDVLFEEIGGEWIIIEDYKEEAAQWLTE